MYRYEIMYYYRMFQIYVLRGISIVAQLAFDFVAGMYIVFIMTNHLPFITALIVTPIIIIAMSFVAVPLRQRLQQAKIDVQTIYYTKRILRAKYNSTSER